ncbi:MAG: U32 family peptidase C-terminal domain-containing protein [Spirochaetales bacterium]|nr:U32 family peptidase C-terminal domain-containing protein [Spirochaetales bacterium]
MELVAPAGNMEKLKCAYLYGADAVYIGIKDFSLRAQADNFSGSEHTEISAIKNNKKLYGALNIYFHDNDIEELNASMESIAQFPFSGVILSDIGIVNVLRQHLPSVPLHLSTQANCINSEAAKAYQDMGFSRIVLGRELNLKQIEQIKNKVNIDIEVFVHGAMCLAYSGRCFLSAYMAERSANKGDCAHSCRWHYRVLEEEERPGEYFPVIEGHEFTSILSSKDLCMVHHLKSLSDAGVDAIKIEGRMKSVYYTAIVTRAYRKALDKLLKKSDEDITAYIAELDKVSHREFWTGFFFEKQEIQKPTLTSYIRSYAFLGTVGEQSRPGQYKLYVKNQIRADDTIEYIGYDVCFIKDNKFLILDENREPVEKADHGKEYYLKTAKKIKPGYIIRKQLKE